MKKKLFLIGILMILFPVWLLKAQETGAELNLSLKDAQTYAIEHNKMVLSSKMDFEASHIAI